MDTTLPAQNIENNTPKIRSIRTLRQWIQQGQLPAGEELPPEKDLANLLNVSRSTVRTAVKSIEDEGLLRYQKNRRRIVVGFAQRNGSLMSNAVVILTNTEIKPMEGNPIESPSGWERFIQIGLIDAIQKAGMHAMTLQVQLLQKTLIKSIVAERPRGVVVMRPSLHPNSTLELVDALRENGVPVVFYGFSDSSKFDTVASDSAAGCYELTKWLISNGRRRILRTGPVCKDIPEWRRQRDAGYERAVLESKLKPLPRIEFPVTSNEEDLSQAGFQMDVRMMVGFLYEYLKGPNPVDALMAISDGACFALAAACRILGREPGKDISIVGYDNYWQDCPLRAWETFVPQATVDKLNIKLGHELMALLLARSQCTLPPEPQQILIKPEIRITGEA